MKTSHLIAHGITFILTFIGTTFLLAAIFKPIPPAPEPSTPTSLLATKPEQIPGCVYIDPRVSKDF
jgi:hypothetical protein